MKRCAGPCGRVLVVKPRPIPDRHTHARASGRGLCKGCWTAAKTDGTLWDYPRVLRPVGDTIADWELLRSEGYTRRLAAERLGMTKKALEKAIARDNRRNLATVG